MGEHQDGHPAGGKRSSSLIAALCEEDNLRRLDLNALGNLVEGLTLRQRPITGVKVVVDEGGQIAVHRLRQESLADLLPGVAAYVDLDALGVPLGETVRHVSVHRRHQLVLVVAVEPHVKAKFKQRVIAPLLVDAGDHVPGDRLLNGACGARLLNRRTGVFL